MSGARIAKLASSFSFAILVAFAMGDTYRDLAKALEPANTAAEVKRISASFGDLISQEEAVSEAFDDVGGSYSVQEVKGLVAIRAAGEAPKADQAKSQIKSIKASPLYADPGVQEESNWLDGAMKRIMDLFPKNGPRSNVNLPQAPVLGWIVPAIWVLLAAIILLFGYFAIRHFSWKLGLTRKAKAMLEDDEPERTLDEWLSLADQHLAEGRFREAVRAMYLSCLLKFDEAGIARFIRGETNWEHLARIQTSSKKPSTIDFRPPTQAFDRIWYGYHVKGREDVEQFRSWYQEITETLRGVKK
ncbi:MAG: hypothetical protein H7Y17_11915 [Chlorobia bacterium]|nr:hypothetical protein [Fimbriimonadaceae bacterium]